MKRKIILDVRKGLRSHLFSGKGKGGLLYKDFLDIIENDFPFRVVKGKLVPMKDKFYRVGGKFYSFDYLYRLFTYGNLGVRGNFSVKRKVDRIFLLDNEGLLEDK